VDASDLYEAGQADRQGIGLSRPVEAVVHDESFQDDTR